MKMKKLTTIALAAALAIGTFGFSVPAKATPAETTTDYVLTIPASLNVTTAGWNATAGITANKSTNNFDTGKKLSVTATSENGDWTLKAEGVIDTVGYKLAAKTEQEKSYADATATTSLDISAENINAGTTISFGVIVEDYSSKPAGTYTDTVTFTASVVAAATDLAGLTGDFVAQDGDTITGTVGSNVKISIADGATVTLNNVSINADGGLTESDYAGITCEGDATIILQGTNTVKGLKSNYAGIYIPSGKTLTIEGDGKLNASSKSNGAGIGAGWEKPCGNIVINSGDITANGGDLSASIGGAYKANCGNITINGGTVNATNTGTMYGIGIGGGYLASCGDITIANTVTKVTATRTGDGQHSIGRGVGNTATCGTITIGGVVTEGITESPYTYQP